MGKKKITNAHVSLLKGTDADPYTAGPRFFSEEDDEIPAIRQSSMYNDHDRARIDNNQFFETRSNPLSSFMYIDPSSCLSRWS